ncbi:hypothetical protein [Rhodanobacter sp. A1T4]|uniref:hypothetical protein n=1 Tax=Rhodanobacter sp. A1T4 TaxID=2723087 RepID=UPI00160DA0B8|nr:hypothetical protein [Rhodanobacter sp. A1T4]MBB6249050.1 hypothetical protein [Rhodanobacter sp. A1T4]
MNKQIQPDENGKDRPPAGDGIPDGEEAPSRPAGAQRGIPARDIDKKNADHENKDGGVKEDGRGRLTRDKE